jgi:SSS family solute:Na+ symporter
MTRETFLAVFTALYVVGMMWLSWWAARKLVKDEAEFMVGGRQFNSFLTVVGLVSLLYSGGYLPGIIMFGYMFGIGGWWYFLTWSVAAVTVLLLWGPFWRVSGAYTPTEWFEYRYGRAGRLVISCVILFAGLAIVGWQFVGSGATMGAALGISSASAMLIVGVSVVVYVALGGIWSATLTDLVQGGWVFFVNFVAVPVYLLLTYGPPDPERLPPRFLDPPFGTIPVAQLTLPSVATFLLMHQSLLNQSPYWTRAAGTLNRRTVVMAWAGAAIICAVSGFLGTTIGVYARMLEPDLANPAMAMGSLNDRLPLVLGALVLGGLMAATMSTVDLYLVSGVNQLVRDVAQALLKIADKSRLLAIGRWATIVYGGLCVVFALRWPDSLAALFGFGTAIGAPLFVYYLDSTVLKVGNRHGAIASAVASLLVVLVWDRLTDLGQRVHTLWIVFPVALVTLVVVSLLVPYRQAHASSRGATAELTDLQKAILAAVAGGYATSADVMDCCAARAGGLQLPDFLRELDVLCERGYLRRKGRRFTGQLHYEITPEAAHRLGEWLGAGDRDALERIGLDGRALAVLQLIERQSGLSFYAIAQEVPLPFDAVGPVVNLLVRRRLARLSGLITPRVLPTPRAAAVLRQAGRLRAPIGASAEAPSP